MNGPVSLEVAKAARAKLRPEPSTGSEGAATKTAQERVYVALELVLAAFLDEIIGELQAEQRPTPPTQRGGARR